MSKLYSVFGQDDRQFQKNTSCEVRTTDIATLWTRPLNYKDFPTVFENNNEYDNSFKAIQAYNMSKLYSVFGKEERQFSHNDIQDGKCTENQNTKNQDNNYTDSYLLCQEDMPVFDDDQIVDSESNHADPYYDSDSFEDKDYIPKSDDGSYSTDSKIDERNQNALMEEFDQKRAKCKAINEKETEQHTFCEYNYCNLEVFSACGKCNSLLCWEHFNDEVFYNDCTSHAPILLISPIGSITNSEKQHKDNGCNVTEILNNLQSDENPSQYCEYTNCKQGVYSTCENCSSFLCLEHFDKPILHNTCDNHKEYIKKQDRRIKKKSAANPVKITDTLYTTHTQHCEYTDCKNEVYGTCDKCNCLLCLEHYVCNSSNICENHEPFSTGHVNVENLVLTKDGNIRKRKYFEIPLENRKKEKETKQTEKYALKNPCRSICRKKCTTKFTEECRKKIHEQYTNLNWESQGLFIKGLVDVKPVERRKQNSKKSDPTRTATFAYYFHSDTSERMEVCKTFFLTTLGYNSKNDRRVLSAINKSFNDQKIKKGSYQRKIFDRDVIKEHVMKYNPTISHYRREHAPNRLYLPSDINITLMYKNFCNENPSLKLSFEVYRKVIRKELNISFAHLGHEECEQCAFFNQHDKDHVRDLNETCEICSKYFKHKSMYTSSRINYQRDVQNAAETVANNHNIIYFSVDLQKVIMLPRIDQYKAAIFCPRIIAYNESFVPLGPTTANNLPFAAIWNETVTGRNQEDIISTFRAFLIQYRDVRDIVLWMDNCSAQNKNWALFSFLVTIVNSELIAAQSITFKYFEPGHTFMSADSFHHQVELSLKRKNKVYDFEDFVDAVKLSNSQKNVVKVMQIGDFYNYQDLSSQARLRKIEPRCYLKNIVAVQALRGQLELQYSTNHDEPMTNTLDFLMLKHKKQMPKVTGKVIARGITADRKNSIIEKLVPLMPESRRNFWYTLPIVEVISNIEEES